MRNLESLIQRLTFWLPLSRALHFITLLQVVMLRFIRSLFFFFDSDLLNSRKRKKNQVNFLFYNSCNSLYAFIMHRPFHGITLMTRAYLFFARRDFEGLVLGKCNFRRERNGLNYGYMTSRDFSHKRLKWLFKWLVLIMQSLPQTQTFN